MTSTKYQRNHGEELRTGSAGCPLSVAAVLHRRVIVNKESCKIVRRELSLSEDVCRRMLILLRRHGLPSKERLIVLSLPYPERTFADIASAFSVTVDYVQQCAARAPHIRRKEPLSSELWEDIEDGDPTQSEIQAAARAIRRANNALVKEGLPGRSIKRASRREGLGGESQVARPGHSARPQDSTPRPQSEKRLLPDAGLRGGRANRNQAPRTQVHKPR